MPWEAQWWMLQRRLGVSPRKSELWAWIEGQLVTIGEMGERELCTPL